MPNPHNELDRGGPADRLLAWRQVGEMTGLSRTTAWRRQKARDFPEPVLVSPGRARPRHSIATERVSGPSR